MLRRISTTAVLVAALFVLAPPAHAADSCAGHPVTIHGTTGHDVINGTKHADVIDAGDGDDVVNGRGGNDIICGGAGADDLRGGAGNNRLYGGLDRVTTERVYTDECSTDAPFYCLEVTYTGDKLWGGSGNDLLVPGYDNRQFGRQMVGIERHPDQLRWDTSPHAVHVNLTRKTSSGEGSDTITAAGVFRVVTSPYADTVVGTNGDDDISTGAGADTVFARDGADRVSAGSSTASSSDKIHGGPGADRLVGGRGPDHLFGDAGDDDLTDPSPVGADEMFGGTGNDDLHDVVVHIAGQIYSGGGDVADDFEPDLRVGGTAAWDMVTGRMTFTQPSATIVTAQGFHEFRDPDQPGTSWHITGTDLADVVTASGTFDGEGGDDTYAGWSGPDTFNGGPGSDNYVADFGGTNTCTSVEHDPQSSCATNTP